MEKNKRIEIIKKCMDDYTKYSEICMKEILGIFEKRKIQPVVAYQILNRLTETMEKTEPKLKLARMITERIIKKIKQRGEPIPEVRMVSLARQKNKEWLKGHKANVWACGMEKTRNDIKTKCEDCGGVCYRSRDKDKDMIKKGAKKICIRCIVTKPKYAKNLNREQRDIMEDGI